MTSVEVPPPRPLPDDIGYHPAQVSGEEVCDVPSSGVGWTVRTGARCGPFCHPPSVQDENNKDRHRTSYGREGVKTDVIKFLVCDETLRTTFVQRT